MDEVIIIDNHGKLIENLSSAKYAAGMLKNCRDKTNSRRERMSSNCDSFVLKVG